MSQATYLIAKYIPDLFRNEPENIGVIVWIDGAVACRFVGQLGDGRINGQLVRDKFRSLANYKQWVESWMRLASSTEVQSGDRRTLVARSSPDFLDALAVHGKGNFILERGGELIEDVSNDSIGEVASFLFERLVGAGDSKPDYQTPEEVRDALLVEARVESDIRVKRNQSVSVELHGRKLRPEFSIYIGNGDPNVLGQMVPLTAQPKQVQNYTQASAFRFLTVLEANKITQDRCVAFVYSQEDRSNVDLIHESIEELQQVSTIVNISADRQTAIRQIRNWVNSTALGH